MKRIMTALAALAAAAALTTGFAAAAQADDAEAAAVCSAVAKEHRSVWAGPAVGDAVGSVAAGQAYDADCALVPGESYTACGATGDQWARVNYAGDSWGYLPGACLTWAS
ncbi:hypothetical protein LO763_02745 [Glycomyces sp. A-F 0318]|uniref:hypothetical protein n=1 Tax=Glycomyces amatae TaxID=2881355 RepID=UPI001E58CACC|nr:hypothetical protein [Glycomyces amatae]MCD0442541.1 hypothetical protein [Glycomyces amatae]